MPLRWWRPSTRAAARSLAAFHAAARQILECAPNTVLKAGGTRESLYLYQLSIFGAMYCALPYADAIVSADCNTFHHGKGAVWIMEVGALRPMPREAPRRRN